MLYALQAMRVESSLHLAHALRKAALASGSLWNLLNAAKAPRAGPPGFPSADGPICAKGPLAPDLDGIHAPHIDGSPDLLRNGPRLFHYP